MTRSLRSAFVSGFVLSLLAAAPPLAPAQQQQGKRTALPRTPRAAITNRFGGNRAAFDRARDQARTRQWKPSTRWMSEEGKRYGRLLIVSDMTPGTGTD